MLDPSAKLPNAIFHAPFGEVAIFDNGSTVERMVYLPEVTSCSGLTPLTVEVIRQLTAYLQDPLFEFSLPLQLQGTAFQQQVWQALQAIPAGEVVSYGALAASLGSAARAIGGACRRNPLPWLIPCHRVVASGGLGGFAGAKVGALPDIKRWLLRHEGIELKGLNSV